jgi:chromosome segregation ATPase
MAADAYLQTALTDLQSALKDLHQQIDGLHRQTEQERQQLQQDMNHIDQQRKVDEAAMVQTADNAQKQVLYGRITQHGHDIDDRKGRMASLDSNVAPLVQRKTQIYNDLQNLVQQLTVMQASPDIR